MAFVKIFTSIFVTGPLKNCPENQDQTSNWKRYFVMNYFYFNNKF